MADDKTRESGAAKKSRRSPLQNEIVGATAPKIPPDTQGDRSLVFSPATGWRGLCFKSRPEQEERLLDAGCKWNGTAWIAPDPETAERQCELVAAERLRVTGQVEITKVMVGPGLNVMGRDRWAAIAGHSMIERLRIRLVSWRGPKSESEADFAHMIEATGQDAVLRYLQTQELPSRAMDAVARARRSVTVRGTVA